MEIKNLSELDSLIASSGVEKSVIGLRVYDGLSAYLDEQSQKTQEGNSLAACHGGIERSNMFNDLMPHGGIKTSKRKTNLDSDSLLSNHSGKGVPLAWFSGMIMDATVSNGGLKLQDYENEVNNLVLIVQKGDEPALNSIFRAMKILSEREKNKLPINIGVIIDNDHDVNLWKKKILDFTLQKKAA
jgi:hypothetical protein